MDRFKAENSQYREKSVQDLVSLKGKTVVITGGARGLAFAWARGCAELGANVAVIDRLEAPDPEFKLLETECGIKAKFYKGDVTDHSGLEAVFEEIVKDFGTLDCLVTGAGIGSGGPLIDTPKEKIQKIIDVNVLGTIYACQLFSRHLIPHKRPGSIVTVASIGAHGGIAGQTNAVYCASKGAVLSFTKSYAVEMAPHSIRVNSISPGFFLTNMTPGYLTGDLDKLEFFENTMPMKRFADRAESKSLVSFLLSDGASYNTGTDVPIDGGLLAG